MKYLNRGEFHYVNSTTKITQPNISPTDEEINYLRNQ